MKIKLLSLFTCLVVISSATTISAQKLVKAINKDLPSKCVKLSPDKSLIAVADDTNDPLAFENTGEVFKIRLYDNKTFSLMLEFVGHKHVIESIDFSPNSEKLVSVDKSGVIIVWDLREKRKVVELNTGSWTNKVIFTSSGNEIVVSQQFEKQSLVYSLTGELILALKVGAQINDFEINRITNNIYFLCPGEIQIWSLVSRNKISSKSLSGLYNIKYDNSFSRLAAGLVNGDIVILDNDLNELKRLKGHFKTVLSLDFNFDNSKLVSGGLDQTIKVWSLEREKELLSISNAHKGKVSAVAFTSDRDQFLTGGENKEIKIWK